jgi:MFS family permease
MLTYHLRMFGYDQGVLSGLLTLDSFQRDQALMTPLDDSNPLCWTDEGPPNRDTRYCHGDANTQAAGVAVYQIGCFLGAVLILFYGERWGRRSSTFWGSAIMIVGGIMQAASFEYGLFVSGRIIGGIGNGMVTSTIPTWQSECARPERRGFLILISGALISGGIMISYWVVYGFYFLSGSVRWRFPVMFQSFFTILVMIGLLFLPDSPRWLLMRGRTEEAREVTARLLGKPEDDPAVVEEVNQITSALKVQNSGGGFKFKELLTNGPSQNLRRTILGITAQFFQQICGSKSYSFVCFTQASQAPDGVLCVRSGSMTDLLTSQLDHLLCDLRLREFARFWPTTFSSLGSSERYRVFLGLPGRLTTHRARWTPEAYVIWCIRHDGIYGYPRRVYVDWCC